MQDRPLTDVEREQLARSIEDEWYRLDRRAAVVQCAFVFSPDAGPDLAFVRCPGETVHRSGLCEFHRVAVAVAS